MIFRNEETIHRVGRCIFYDLLGKAVVNFPGIKTRGYDNTAMKYSIHQEYFPGGDLGEAKPPRYLHQSFKATEMERNLRQARITVISLPRRALFILGAISYPGSLHYSMHIY